MPLEITGLVTRFGSGADAKEVVRGIDLKLRPGECFALLGPNGAGKTTTLRCALGLMVASAGRFRLGGLPVPGPAPVAPASVRFPHAWGSVLPWAPVIRSHKVG